MSTPTHPLQIRDYRLVWLARFASVAATTAMVVVVAAQTYQIARTDYGYDTKQAAFLIGTLGLAQFIPFLLLTRSPGWWRTGWTGASSVRPPRCSICWWR